MHLCSKNSIRALVKSSHPRVVRAVEVSGNYSEILQERMSDVVSVLKRPKDKTNSAGHGLVERVTIKNYFDNMCANNTHPDYDWIILHELASDIGLRDKILAHSLIDSFPEKTSFRLWATPQHSFTGAHFDSCETFNLQLSGKKRFVLYPPGLRRYKSCTPFGKFGHTSRFNDFEKVERTERWEKILARRLEFVLNPGDMIYIPPGWWHQVYNDNSFSVNVLINLSAGMKLLKHPYILFDSLCKKIF
jgi:hypothetical protein